MGAVDFDFIFQYQASEVLLHDPLDFADGIDYIFGSDRTDGVTYCASICGQAYPGNVSDRRSDRMPHLRVCYGVHERL